MSSCRPGLRSGVRQEFAYVPHCGIADRLEEKNSSLSEDSVRIDFDGVINFID